MTNVQVIMSDRQTARSERPLRASYAATREAAMAAFAKSWRRK